MRGPQPRSRRRRRGESLERSGKRTGKRPGDEAFLTGERLAPSQPTEGASGALICIANLSGKADSEGPEQPTIGGLFHCPWRVPMSAELLKTPLHAWHVEHGARMVSFAGYDMPVNYTAGIIAEHKQCRASAALFDVSHMGQVRLVGDDAAKALETLVPVDVAGLAVGKQRYAFFTNAVGRHPRRPDGHAARERPAARGQRRQQGSRHPAPGDEHRPPLPGAADARARVAGAAGAAGRGRAGPPEPGGGGTV